jgi:RHS repeat-associated protein
LEQTIDPTGTIDFAYDAKGRLQTVTEGSDSLTRDYDDLDRVSGFTDSQGNTIGYQYDGGNHLTQLIYPGSNGDVNYTYDAAGRLMTVTDWANRETEFYYDSNSRLWRIDYPNGTKREYFYDSAGRVEQMVDTHIASGVVLLDQQYEFDALGRITEEVVSPEPATYTITPAVMTYDDDDRISTWQSGAVNISPVFDDDGNLITGVLEGASGTFVYDSRNRLTAAGTSTYVYDAENRRISKTESGVTTTFVHDPHAPLSRLLQKTTAGTTSYYVYAGGQLLYEETDGEIQVYHFDSRGSTLALSDDTGYVVNRISYGTYGEIVSTESTPSTPFLYNGAYGVQTDDNGLMHMRARYYSPELRRFINADPIGFAGGMNWYAYASGNPMMFFDPSGLKDFGLMNSDPNFVRPEVSSFGDFLDIMFTDFPAAVYQGVTGIPGQMAGRGREIKAGGDPLSVYIGGSIEFAGGVGSVVKVPGNIVYAGQFHARQVGLFGEGEAQRAALENEAFKTGASLALKNPGTAYNFFIAGNEPELGGAAFASQAISFVPRMISNYGNIRNQIHQVHNSIDNFTGVSSGFSNSNGFSNFIFNGNNSSATIGFK